MAIRANNRRFGSFIETGKTAFPGEVTSEAIRKNRSKSAEEGWQDYFGQKAWYVQRACGGRKHDIIKQQGLSGWRSESKGREKPARWLEARGHMTL